MDIREQVKKWVEKKVQNVVNKDLRKKIVEETSTIDVEMYVNYLLNKYFSDEEIENFREILRSNSNYDLLHSDFENSSEDQNSVNDSIDLETNEYQAHSADEIIKNLKSGSEDVQKKYLKALESCAEDLITQDAWNNISENLQKILNKRESREIQDLALKVYQKPLRCLRKAQIVSKGFTTVAEVLTNQINKFNLEMSSSFEEIYDIKEDKWLHDKKFKSTVNENYDSSEIMIELMWLLIECQNQIPAKWASFNEARFREIIFSFIRLLSSTTLESRTVSGLEILSVLNPSAGWSRYWCHTAVGRNLLTSALRKYKSFFIHIIENILVHIRTKKVYRLPYVRDSTSLNKISPTFRDDVTKISSRKGDKMNVQIEDKNTPTSEDSNSSINIKLKKKNESSKWIIASIPKAIVLEAVFFHSISFVSSLIQFRSGRALFPVQTVTKKRLLSVQDLSLTMIQYLENIQCYNMGLPFTSAYEAKIKEILDTLRKVKTRVDSSRMSKDRQHFSYF